MVLGKALLFVFLCLQPPKPTHSSPLEELNGKSIRFDALETNFGGTQVRKPRTFTLGRKLGNGGYGIVIAAKMEIEGNEPAVAATFKFVPDVTDKEAINGLNLEQKIYDLLENKVPGFLAYIGGGHINLASFGNRFVIATEIFQTNLGFLAFDKSIPSEWEKKIFAVEFLMISITTLRSLHEMGIVHRDVKPDNLLVRKNPDGSIDLALIDFGLVQLPNDEPSAPLFHHLFSSKANHNHKKPTRLSNPGDDWEGMLYTFCFFLDAGEWGKLTMSEALARKENFPEYLAKKFANDPILLSALNYMVADDSYKNWDSGKNAKDSFKFADHLVNLQNALNDLETRRPKTTSQSYRIGSLRPNQPTLKPITV